MVPRLPRHWGRYWASGSRKTQRAFVLALALSTAAPALAQRATIDIPAGRLADAIATLSAQAGVSIGASGALPDRRVPAIRGRMDVGVALARMLAGTGWRARQLRGGVWRIEAMPATPAPAQRPRAPNRAPAAPLALPPDPEIVVTGRKRAEPLAAADATIMVISGTRLDQRGAPLASADVAQMVDGLSVTSMGSGRNRLFIRGVADSPFDGFGQASVSVVIDDARATYDAPDPDIRLVDMERVELLKGPQGPLYGTGALGGIYRLVTRKPDMVQAGGTVSAGIDSVHYGTIGTHAQGVLNLPIVADRAAVRLVGYRSVEPGWIDTAGGARDINRSIVSGGRLALRVLPSSGWTVDLAGLVQTISARDSRYVDGAGATVRAPRIREPHDVDFGLGGLTVTGALGTLALTSATSISRQELRATYDASASAGALGGSAPASYLDDRHYRVLNQELRLASPAAQRIAWLAGLSVLDAATDAAGTLSDAAGARDVLTLRRRVREIAGFGEATLHWSQRLSATVGGRVFHSYIEDEKYESGDTATLQRQKLHFAPSVSMRWNNGAGLGVYARYAGSLRPGGAEARTGDTTGSYGADEISTSELGARIERPGLALTGAMFLTYWKNVQADFLPATGLVTTRNVGNAVDRGIEVSGEWRPAARLSLSAGAILHRGRLGNPSAAVAQGGDRRLPIVPDIALRGAVDQGFVRGAWTLHALARAQYVGAARLSFDTGLDRRIPPRAVLGAGLSAERGAWSIRADLDNLLDSTADSFGFGNPFSIRDTPQRTPIRPRSLSLTIGRRF
ncbi:TonB-dependent receptor domain-containing protein [Sphingomonas sp. CJ20]